MFWFKKKKIVLDCFTVDPFVSEFAKIDRATKYYPQWWRDLPNSAFSELDGNSHSFPTLKSCRGFTELFRNSFILPFWGNLSVDIQSLQNPLQNPVFKWEADFTLDSKTQAITQHPTEQFDGFVDDKYVSIKLSSPWFFKSNRLVNFVLSDPVWCRRGLSDYTVLPGILDFKYQHSTNVNLFAELRNEPRNITWRPFDPIAMLTPQSEEKVTIKSHLVDSREMERVFSRTRLVSPWHPANEKYRQTKKFIQQHEERNKPKCPFGFGK